jgi:hypothetical protein
VDVHCATEQSAHITSLSTSFLRWRLRLMRLRREACSPHRTPLKVAPPRRLDGQSCAYCYTSAALSALILLATVPGWKTKDLASGA